MLLLWTFLEKLENNLDAVLKRKDDVSNMHIQHLYTQMCTFLQDYKRIRKNAVQSFIGCTVKYIECITSYVNTLEQDVYGVQRFCSVIGNIPNLPEVRDTYLQEISKIIFEKVTESVEPVWFLNELLVTFDTALHYFDKDELNNFMSDNMFCIYKLTDVLNLCGDYNYQVKILEIIFHMCSANQIKEHSRNCFPESKDLQNAFEMFQSTNFNFHVRKFLNLVNCKNTSVVSVKCERVMLDTIWVGAPKGSIESELWVDFNNGSDTISILCDVDSLRTSLSPVDNNSTEAWENIIINISDIQNVLLSRWFQEDYRNSRGAVICFNLINPCSVLYESSKQATLAKQLKLGILKGSALRRLDEHVLPRMKDFQRLLPLCYEDQQTPPLVSTVESSRQRQKPSVNGISVEDYNMNSMSFQSGFIEHSDEPCVGHDETNFMTCDSYFTNRAKSNNQKLTTGIHLPLLNKKISQSSNESVASTHLTDCVLDYIDLTIDDGDLYNLNSQKFIEAPQNINVAAALYSEEYYSIPEASATAAVFGTTCSNHNESMQLQSNDLKSQYFTAEEGLLTGNTYTSNSLYLRPVVVENRPLRNLLSVIDEQEEEEETLPEMGFLSIGSVEATEHEPVDNIVQNQSLEINKTEKKRPKLVAVGNYSENVPLATKTRVHTDKRRKTTKHRVEYTKKKTNSCEKNSIDTSENISDKPSPNFEEVLSQEESKKRKFATKRGQDIHVHVGSESGNKEPLKQPKKPIEKKCKIDTHSQNRVEEVALNEIMAKTFSQLTKQPNVVLRKLDEGKVGEEHHASLSNLADADVTKINKVQQMQEKLVKTVETQIKDKEENRVQKGSPVTEKTRGISVGDVYAHINTIHHLPKPQLKNDNIPMPAKDANPTEGNVEGTLGNSLVNIEVEIITNRHESVFVDPLPPIKEYAYTEKYTSSERCRNDMQPVIESTGDQQNEDPKSKEHYILAQKSNEDHEKTEQLKEITQSSAMLKNNINQEDENRFQQATNVEDEEYEADEIEQNDSAYLANFKNINKQSEPLKNIEEMPSNDDRENTDQEESTIFKRNMDGNSQFDVVPKTCNDTSPIMNEGILEGKNNKGKKQESNTKETHTKDFEEFYKRVPVVNVVRLNIVRDKKTKTFRVDNKISKEDRSEKVKNILDATKSLQCSISINESMISTPNDDKSQYKAYDVHTEVVLSQSRKYRKRRYPEIQNEESIISSRKQKNSHVRKLYNLNDLSYTRFFNEHDFEENTYLNSTKGDAKISKGPTHMKLKDNQLKKMTQSVNRGQKIVKKSANKKDENATMKRNVVDKNLKSQNKQSKVRIEKKSNAQGNTTFSWMLKKQARETESKMTNKYEKNKKGTSVADEKEAGAIEDEYDDILFEEKEDEYQIERKRKENTAFKNALGKTQRKRRKEIENLDAFDSILTNSERTRNRTITLAKEALTNSRSSNHSPTHQNDVTTRSRNDYDFSSVFDIFEKTALEKSFNTTISRGKRKNVKRKGTKTVSNRDKKLYDDSDVMRGKKDGYESLYSDGEDSKPPIKRKKSTIKSESHKYTNIIPVASNKITFKRNEVPQKKQASSESIPLPELIIENEIEVLRNETQPRLTSSDSTVQKCSEEIMLPRKVNVLSNIVLKAAPQNNITLHPSSKTKEVQEETLQQIPDMQEFEELSSATATGVSPDADIKIILEAIVRAFKRTIEELLLLLRGPVPNDLLKLYEMLVKWDNHVNNVGEK